MCGFLEVKYYSGIMLPSNKTLWGLIRRGAYLQKRFLGGGFYEAAYSEMGACWRIYGSQDCHIARN